MKSAHEEKRSATIETSATSATIEVDGEMKEVKGFLLNMSVSTADTLAVAELIAELGRRWGPAFRKRSVLLAAYVLSGEQQLAKQP